MTNKKNWRIFIIILLLSIAVPILLLRFSLINVDGIVSLGSDFHYNMISMSAIIGGFLFTGISILISAIDKERIQRLWQNNYLDNLYRAAFVGMIANVLTIITAVAFLCAVHTEKAGVLLIKVEFITLFIGLVFFIWSIKHLLFIITTTFFRAIKIIKYIIKKV